MVSGNSMHTNELWDVPPESPGPAAILVLDHGTIVLREGEMICRLGEGLLASVFSGLGEVFRGRGLDFTRSDDSQRANGEL